MKKIYSCMLAMSMALAANAADYYLIGGFNGWTEKDPACGFELQLDGSYVLDYEGTLTPGFKINDGTWTNDAANFGAEVQNAPVTLGEVFNLTVGGSSKDIGLSEAVENPHIVFDPTAATLVITGATAELSYTYDLWGNFDGSASWSSTSLNENNGKWVAKGIEVAKCNFGIRKLADGKQTDWIASAADAEVILNTTMACMVNGTNFALTAGTYDFTFDPEAMTLTVAGEGETPVDPDPVDPDPVDPTPGEYRELNLVGEFNGWDAANGPKFTREDNVYTLVLEDGLAGEWKICDGTWDYSFGAGENTEVVSSEKMDAWYNGVNFTCAFEGKTTIVFTLVEGSDVIGSSIPSKLIVTNENGETPVDPTPGEYRELNLVGEFNGWDPAEGPKFTREGNVYTLVLEDGLAGEWKICDGTWDYSFGAGENTEVVSGEKMDAWYNGVNFTCAFEGKTTIVFTLVEGSDAIGSSIPSNIVVTNGTSVGATMIEATEGEAVYYTLQGVKVNNPSNGMFVKIVDGKATKVVVK